jgi:acyl carrier protein
MSEQELEAQVRSVIRRTFNLPSDELEMRMGAVPGWDSMGHMDLVIAIESVFNVTFSTAVIADLVDIRSICRVIERATKA